jgi:hypothetical protein
MVKTGTEIRIGIGTRTTYSLFKSPMLENPPHPGVHS